MRFPYPPEEARGPIGTQGGSPGRSLLDNRVTQESLYKFSLNTQYYTQITFFF